MVESKTTQMRAAVCPQYGPPEVVKIVDRPIPALKNDHVLVRIYASTVNRTDCGFRSAEYFVVRFFGGLFKPKNPILGCEFAGKVETVGSKVTSFKPGDAVFGYNDISFGGHAEYIAVHQDSLALIPPGLTYEESAPILEGSHYALGSIRAAKVSSHSHVLVNGATGAIGSAAVQLLKYFGTNVTAVCDTKNVERVRSLGADRVIDYTKEDFTKCGEIFDFVFDAVGKRTFGACKPLLVQKGVYISTEPGPGWQNLFLALVTPLFGGKRILFPIPKMTKEIIQFLKERVESNSFKPVIDRTYGLDDISQAYRYVETGMKTGNVVLRIRTDDTIH